jgi:hypothetical protein
MFPSSFLQKWTYIPNCTSQIWYKTKTNPQINQSESRRCNLPPTTTVNRQSIHFGVSQPQSNTQTPTLQVHLGSETTNGTLRLLCTKQWHAHVPKHTNDTGSDRYEAVINTIWNSKRGVNAVTIQQTVNTVNNVNNNRPRGIRKAVFAPNHPITRYRSRWDRMQQLVSTMWLFKFYASIWLDHSNTIRTVQIHNIHINSFAIHERGLYLDREQVHEIAWEGHANVQLAQQITPHAKHWTRISPQHRWIRRQSKQNPIQRTSINAPQQWTRDTHTLPCNTKTHLSGERLKKLIPQAWLQRGHKHK